MAWPPRHAERRSAATTNRPRWLRATVHRLSARLPRRTFCHEPAAARPLPDAGRSRRYAGADLCAARRPGRRDSARGIAVGDDGAALRGLQGRGGPPVLPRSFFAARSADRAGRCALGVQCRSGGAASISKQHWPDSGLLPDRPQLVSQYLFRPRIDRILFAATKADHLHHLQPRPPGSDVAADRGRAAADGAEHAGATIDVVALAAVRATREAQVARGREKLPSILGTPAAGESAGGEAL